MAFVNSKMKFFFNRFWVLLLFISIASQQLDFVFHIQIESFKFEELIDLGENENQDKKEAKDDVKILANLLQGEFYNKYDCLNSNNFIEKKLPVLSVVFLNIIPPEFLL